MTKDSKHAPTDSEAGSVIRYPINKLTAILCPAVCALILVVVFCTAFLASRMAWDRYDTYCNRRRIEFAKLYIFPDSNITMKIKPILSN